MLRFLHGYLEESWPGLVRRGLIDDTSGVKFHQNYDTPDGQRFNRLAQKEGRLYQIVRECARPFYLDRLQGGWWFFTYPFDRQLLREYLDLSGEWMLGLQMHEWASNMQNDWRRIQKGLPDGDERLTAADIRRITTENCHIPGVRRPFLESASAEEYARMKLPRSAEEAIGQYKALFQLRQQQYMGLLLPTDSYFMAIRYELACGARALMPEVGAQIPLARWQVALTRGMARAAGIFWGTYYEPWGGDPFGCCYYKRDFVNEWNVPSSYSGLFAGFLPGGGSSRALQKRIYLHSLLSGADFVSEEWGNANTFYDWQDFELTPYGQVKKEFIDFLSLHRNLGDVVVPVALVLPKVFEVFDLAYLSQQGDSWLGYPLADPKQRKQFNQIRTVLRILLGDAERRCGNEGHVIGNSAYGDVFDIVYEDIAETALQKYDILIDLSLTPALTAKYPQLAGKVICSQDIAAMEQVLQTALSRLLPCRVTGALSWILNRTEGGWVLGLLNNEGVDRSQKHGEVFRPEADIIARIEAPACRLDVLWGPRDCLSDTGNGAAWHCAVPAGQAVLLKLVRMG